jgi:putative ABC transport system permease protein
MELGAQGRDVLYMILHKGALLALLGAVIGLAASRGLTRMMSGMLIGVSPADPITFISVVVLRVSIALAACYFPARRATKVGPVIALRCE